VLGGAREWSVGVAFGSGLVEKDRDRRSATGIYSGAQEILPDFISTITSGTRSNVGDAVEVKVVASAVEVEGVVVTQALVKLVRVQWDGWTRAFYPLRGTPAIADNHLYPPMAVPVNRLIAERNRSLAKQTVGLVWISV